MKQKIIQVSAYYPPHLGGQENVVQSLSKQLARRGHPVDVITSACGSAKTGVSNEDGVTVHRYRAVDIAHTPIVPLLFFRLLRIRRNETVHLHIGQAFTPEVVLLASKIKGFSYVAELHADALPSGRAGFLLAIYKKLFLARVLRAAARVLVLNEEHSHLVRRVYKYQGSILIVKNGIDQAFFEVKREVAIRKRHELSLLYVGRLSEGKNILALVHALQHSTMPIHLDIVGEGEVRSELERARQNLRSGLTIQLHGQLDRVDVMARYQQCDALVLPTLYEAQPLTLLEAMAAKVPIIASDIPNVAQLVGSGGVLCKPTPAGIQGGVERFARLSKSDIDNMTQLSYQAATEFSWERLYDSYESIYKEVERA